MKKTLLIATALLVATASFSQENTIKKLKTAFQSDYFQLNGYGQIIANYSEFPDRGQQKLTAQNSLDITRAILFAQGKLGAKQQFGYMLMYDFGPSSGLHELYGEWLPINAVNVRLGQYKIPFTLENPMSPTRIETVFFTRSASAMAGSVGDFNGLDKPKAGRDAGLQVSGRLFKKDDFFQLEYYTGLFNGTGFNTKDNNSHKDFIGTAYYQPIKGLRVGGSVYSGKLYYGLNGATAEDHVRNRWTVGAEYNAKYFYGRSEYIAANDGGLRREGAYASLVWKFVPDKWEVLGKYDYYDDGNKKTQDITAGVNYYFARLSRLQLNYIFTDDEALGKNNAAALQLQLFF
ncbi:MAG: OprO/OprP family phosphate-selective porin [Prevotellaceae bacterium]|jgi:phosphate-selective porin|nr:OprO/OprP family phosphate-selective porin [Prevotellaceae bacterium]